MARFVALLLLLTVPVRLAAQADTTGPHFIASFGPIRVAAARPEARGPAVQGDTTGPHLIASFGPVRIVLAPPAAYRLAALLLHPASARPVDRWAASVQAGIDSARAVRAAALAMRGLFRSDLAVEEGDTTGVFGLNRRYADLAIDGQARVEVRTQRDKNERCTPYELLDPASACRGTFTAPRIDNELTMQAGGLIGQRLHVNIDYDSQRDFSANNNVKVYYQGLEDEVVQRVEFGTVTFTPPPSHFITATIPANSFGVDARFQIGDLQIQALAASQKGSVVAERHYTIGSTTSQPQNRQLRDLDFEAGRFFWVVDPAFLPGYPAVDILNLDPAVLPPVQRPAQIRIYQYRPVTQSTSSTGLTGITAVATRTDSPQATGRLRWQLLVPGTDYYLDPSGTWFVLSTRLDVNAYLAVSYVTAAGTKVGTFPSQDNPAGADSLQLIVEPRRGPEVPTFRYEMRQVYRVAGTDLDRSSLQLAITVNQSEHPLGGAATYLAQLGLAVSGDPHVLDIDNRVFPRTRDPGASQVVHESYIVFPGLQPLADPTRLQPAERDDSLYRTPVYLLATQGPPVKFTFGLTYNAALGGDRSTLALNAFQLRPESEQLIVNGQTLVRDVDYTISYDLGQVTFLNPDQLFGSTGAVDVTARFEERGIFAVAPTSIFGLTSTYKIGDVGSVNLIGIYQRQQSAFNRPPIGFEPTANFTGGITTNLTFQPSALTRLMNGLTPAGATAPSRVDFSGELAFTQPNVNEAGAAYLEDFEGNSGVAVSLRENGWGFGSRPQRPDGLEGIGFAAGFDSADAVMLTWQNLINFGGQALQIRTTDIDSLIRVTGGSPLETVLWLGFHPDTAGGFPAFDGHPRWTFPARPGQPRWRSMVTSLSQTGVDLASSEYLEFWVYQTPGHETGDSADVRLVFDLGSVNEDALAIVPESLTVVGADSAFHGRRYSGVGRLDTERESTGIFDAAADDIGILQDRPDSLIVNGVVETDVPLCRRQLANTVPLYNWGDLDVRCTNGNGTLDSEDLNGDNVLNATGANDNVNRYIVDLASSTSFVRNGRPGWRLYRIPLRSPDAVIGSPDLHLVQHLRITVVAPSLAGTEFLSRFALARMQFVGSSWLARAATPIQGFGGSIGLPTGEVVIGTVSTENQELGYVPPPGAVDQSNLQTGVTSGVQVNETSLRIVANDLHLGQRAEAVGRFPTGPQNLLKYNTLRLWVRGRGAGWEDGQLQAVFKVGSDDRDFYAYRIGAFTTTWLPEVQIDLDTWRRLRAQIEVRWLNALPPNGGTDCGIADSTAYVACQGNYLVQVGNPGINPPNLAAVQEMAVSIYRTMETTSLPQAELWVDDIRMTDPISAVGRAVALSAHVAASDVADLSFSYIQQDGNFQQIGQDPTYQTTSTAQVSTATQLDRFLPTSLGVAAPLSVSYSTSSTDPELLQGTDLRGADLVGLRRPTSQTVNWGVALRRTKVAHNWFIHTLLDPLSLSAAGVTGQGTALLSTSSTSSLSLNAQYSTSLAPRGPVFDLTGLVDLLPAFLRKGPVGQGLRHPRLVLTPSNIHWSSGFTRNDETYSSFLVPVSRPSDSAVAATQALSHLWRNAAGLAWQPLAAVTGNIELASTRDLRVYPDSTPIGRLADASRESFLGLDAGVERDRSLISSLSFLPQVASWLRPRVSRSSSFVLNRYLTGRDPIRADGDTIGRFLLPQTLNSTQAWEVGASVDLARGLASLFGPASRATRATAGLRPLDISRRTTLSSTFDLAAFDPGLGFQLATGGLGDFLNHDGTAALGATQGRTDALTTGATLPGGFTVTASYQVTIASQYSLIQAQYLRTDSRQTDWPVGSIRWSAPITKGPIALLSTGLAARRSEATNTTPASDGGSIAGHTLSTSLSPDAAVTFRSGLSLNVAYSVVGQINANNGNETQSDQRTLNATLSDAFRLPESLSRLRRTVRGSLTALRSVATTCLRQAASDCTGVSDTRRTEINGAFYTDVLAIAEAGLSAGYSVNEVRELNQLTTSLFISLSLNIQLSSGANR